MLLSHLDAKKDDKVRDTGSIGIRHNPTLDRHYESYFTLNSGKELISMNSKNDKQNLTSQVAL